MNRLDTRVIWCRCGEVLERRTLIVVKHQWRAIGHVAPPHRIAIDDYRAPCRPWVSGCRQCGAMPTGRKVFYCSDPCREEFEADHFWGTARTAAIARASTWLIPKRKYQRLDETFCQRCFVVIGAPTGHWMGSRTDTAEVNHIVPVNGAREAFGCSNHQANLEALCHACHLEATAEQRRQGLIGRPRLQEVSV